jgi:hypothetical protein
MNTWVIILLILFCPIWIPFLAAIIAVVLAAITLVIVYLISEIFELLKI